MIFYFNIYKYNIYNQRILTKRIKTMSIASVIVSAKDVLDSYNMYKNDFLRVDLSNVRENQGKTVKYTRIVMKLPSGEEVNPIVKFFNQRASNKIKAPEERDYEQLKVSIRKDNNVDNSFGTAMELICETFIKKVKELKSQGLISDDIDDDNNQANAIIFPSCKPQTPLQKRAKDKKQGNVVLTNPLFWFGLNYKRYSVEELKDLKSLEFSYKNDGKPFIVKEFDVNIYDLDDTDDNIPNIATVNGNTIDNTNIQDFLTSGSLISGTVYMQVIASNQSFNLNTKISNSLYVKSNKDHQSNRHAFDSNEFAEMLQGAKDLNKNTSTNTNTQQDKSVNEYDEYDNYGDVDTQESKIANLTL